MAEAFSTFAEKQKMENISFPIQLLFGLCVIYAMMMFYFATGRSKKTLFVLLAWLLIQSIVGLSGFYTNTQSLPPRFILLPFPPLVVMALIFFGTKGKEFVMQLNMGHLILLHAVRIPVEIVLWLLATHHAVPKLMTFEGLNFDLLSGLSAIPMYWAYRKKRLHKNGLIIWQVLCLLLLLNIVFIAIFSAPFQFQHFAFDQPNVAVLYFPFHLLPGIIVPLVLFAHLAALKKIFGQKLMFA